MKNTLVKFQNITNGDMSQASITSVLTNSSYMNDIGIQLQWTGSPVGTFAVQVSIDHAQDQFGNVTVPGTWVNLEFNHSNTIDSSVGSPIFINLQQISVTWLRVVYNRTSGTGTLNGFIAGKVY